MNIVDIGIVIMLLFGAILGFKRGFTNELVNAIGLILVIALAFIFKNPLSSILYEHLPFFSFGFLKGATILNILLYEVIAFLILVAIFSLLLNVLKTVTSLFEKLLNATIILGIPSKLLGAVLGVVQEYIIIFIILYILTLFGINVPMIGESNLRNKIVDETPVLSEVSKDWVNVIDEFKSLKKDYNSEAISSQEFNYKGMELFLKYKIISVESASKLIEDGKLNSFDYYQDLFMKYKEV